MTAEVSDTFFPELTEIRKFYKLPAALTPIDEPLTFQEWRLIPLLVERPREWRYPTLLNKKDVPGYDPLHPRAHDFRKNLPQQEVGDRPKRKHRRGKRRSGGSINNASGGGPCSGNNI